MEAVAPVRFRQHPPRIDTLPDKDVFYRYDLAGKVTAMVYPDGTEARYAYDAAGRLAGVTDAGGNALATYAYDHDGRMTTHAVGGTLATGAYAYNTRDWVTGIDYPGRFTLSQAYDAVGNVTSQRYRRATTEARTAATYTYDGLHRLKTFGLGSTHARTYAYDDNGNVTSVRTGSDTAAYAYSRSSTPNRLDSITVAGSTDTFVYDGAGNLTANYLYAGGDRLARVAGGVVSYYLKDHLGSTRTLLSSAGNAAATYDYWPYGEVLATGGTDATPFRFTGHERDVESGLDFMQYRTYGPGRLRFLQVDPAAEKYPGLSPYAYAANNPLTFIDARGDTLDVGGMNDGQKALSYLHSMVDSETAKRITMGDGGRVSFDTEGLDLSEDSALELLDNLVNSSEKYLFEVERIAEGAFRNSGKDGLTGKPIKAGDPRYLEFGPKGAGIKVFSRTPESISITGVEMGLLPKPGYGGQVVLAPGSWTSSQGNPIPVGDVTFHELSEAFYRTDRGMLYQQAHRRALRDAERHKNRGVPPSVLDGGVNFHLSL